MKGISSTIAILCLCVIMTVKAAPADDSINTGSNKVENDILTRDKRDTGIHFTEEILAQAMCQSQATKSNLYGRVYAVGRQCPDPWYTQLDDCKSICKNPLLHAQDHQTVDDTWSCIGAYHVYLNRPATTTNGQQNTATLGLKSKQQLDCADVHCGPNYCCCYAEPE